MFSLYIIKLYPLLKYLYKINRKKKWNRFFFFFQISVSENQKKSSGSESINLDERGEQPDAIYN